MDHPPNLWRVGLLDRVVDPPQPKRAERVELALVAPIPGLALRDPERAHASASLSATGFGCAAKRSSEEGSPSRAPCASCSPASAAAPLAGATDGDPSSEGSEVNPRTALTDSPRNSATS